MPPASMTSKMAMTSKLAMMSSTMGWTFYFLSYFVCLTAVVTLFLGSKTATAAELCPFPAVPYAASYSNLTGGPTASKWSVQYNCDKDYEIFGEQTRHCVDGKWKGDLPICAVNVAIHKPASASSVANGGRPQNAVDGKTSTVHEGKKCTETQSEKSPWWTVDLLEAVPVEYVRLTTRCCDDLPLKNAEIRVGNSETPASNALCNWIPKALDEGITETFECVEPIVGRYVSIVRSGVEDILSLCEVEVFSTSGLSAAASCEAVDLEDSRVAVFEGNCFHFMSQEVAGFNNAVDECQEENGALLDHLTKSSTQFVINKIQSQSSDQSSSKTLMVWVGAMRERTSNFRGEEWRWESSKDPVTSIPWGRGQPNNYKQEQNCAVLDSDLDFGWNDLSCSISAIAVCRSKPSKCPSPKIEEGTTATISKDRKSITYHCPVGEMPVGKVNQTCENIGIWSGLPIGCKRVECGQVPGLANGEIHVLDGRTTYGARVRYKCKTDYSLIGGKDERICVENGWSGTSPECVYTKCPELDPVDNADVTIIGDRANYLGSKISYKCKEGHKASGSLSRECLQGGLWSGSPPRCEFLDCGNPPQVSNGKYTLLNGRTTFGAAVEYKCDQDYLPVGDTNKKCEAEGQWSRSILTCDIIECPQPKAPSGGRVSGFNREIHSKIEYSCFPGHVLEGQSMVTCTSNGLWSSRVPNCRFVDCGRVPDLDSGTVHYVNKTTHLGSVVRYSCGRSHSIIGYQERTCLPNGKWSGTIPNCSEIRCSLPTKPNNTIVSVSSTERLHGTSVIRSKFSEVNNSYRVGATLKYRCERGFILKSMNDKQNLRVMTRRCTTSGQWTGDTPFCTFVDCGSPEIVQNSEYQLQTNNATYFGSVVTYHCNPHFKLEGFERRRCETSGKWEPEAPICKETLCKPLEKPANGSMILTTLRIGGRATFTCNEGFSLQGDDDIECLSSGSWSSWPPTCLEVDCGQPFDLENGRLYLTNGTTNIGSIVEYHCFPEFERHGDFQRVCLEDGYWSGPEPKCNKPTTRRPISILSDNTVDGTHNIRAGNRDDPLKDGGSSVGLIIGIVLGLILAIGLMFIGVYFCRKQHALAAKPPAPYRDRNANGGVSMVGGYASTGVYHTASNGPPQPGGGLPPRTAGINTRAPPPPIQMYSMDEAAHSASAVADLQPTNNNGPAPAPIYDTINDDHSSGGSGYAHSGSDRYTPSTFKNGGSSFHAYNNSGMNHDYDTPEGSEPNKSSNTVTINGIAV